MCAPYIFLYKTPLCLGCFPYFPFFLLLFLLFFSRYGLEVYFVVLLALQLELFYCIYFKLIKNCIKNTPKIILIVYYMTQNFYWTCFAYLIELLKPPKKLLLTFIIERGMCVDYNCLYIFCFCVHQALEFSQILM